MWYLKALKSWWLLLVVAAVVAGALALLPHQAVYRSEASMLFKFGREYLYNPDVGDGRAISGSRIDLRNAINAEAKIFQSTAVLENALAVIGADRVMEGKDVPENLSLEEAAVEALKQDLSLHMIENSTVMQVRFDHHDPSMATQCLQAIIDSFLAKRREIYQDSSLPLITRQLAKVTEELSAAEARLQNFNEDNDIFEIDEQQNQLLSMKLQSTNDLMKAHTEEKQYRANLALLEGRLEDTPKTIQLYADREINEQVKEARNKMLELSLERQSLKGRYRDSSQKVRQIESEIKNIESFLANQQEYTPGTVRTGRNPLYDNLLSEKLTLQAKLDSVLSLQPVLERNIANTELELRKIDKIRTQQRSFKTTFELLEQRHRQYAEQADRAGLAKTLSDEATTNARLIQTPTQPNQPIGLSRTNRVALASSMGLLFSAGLALLLQWTLDNRARGADARADRYRSNTSGQSNRYPVADSVEFPIRRQRRQARSRAEETDADRLHGEEDLSTDHAVGQQAANRHGVRVLAKIDR